MILLSDVEAPAERVTLAPGSWVEVRPCTALQSYEARERARPLIAGLLLGRRSEDEIAAILGAEFGEVRGTDDPAFAAAASERLALIEIVAMCAVRWEGIGNADGSPAEINRANVARLLRVPAWANQISEAVNRPLYERRVEGNASAASPSGAAAAADSGAPIVSLPESDAPMADETATADSAQNTKTSP